MCTDVLGFSGWLSNEQLHFTLLLQAKLVLTMPNVTIALGLHSEEGSIGHAGSTFCHSNANVR